MIAIRRVARLDLRTTLPALAHLAQRPTIDWRAGRSDPPGVERAAIQAARHRRAEAVRIDAERHWHGLDTR